MENSLNESEAQQSFHSPIKRRRSTFFERRESFAPQTQTENYTPNIQNIDSGGNERPNERKYDENELSKYYDKLLQEKQDWKKEVKERRNKYHDLKQQLMLASKSTTQMRMSYSALSTEDIEYLKAKPNIMKLVESQSSLHNSVNDMRVLYNKVMELDTVILDHCKDRINKINQHILDNSTID